MLEKTLARWRCLVVMLVSLHAVTYADLVPVGKGAYTTTIPTGAKGPTNNAGALVTPKTASGFSQLPTTNDWWSSLIWQYSPTNPWSENLFAHPLSFKAFAGGLEAGYPRTLALTPDITAPKGHKLQEYHYNHIKELTIGVVGMSSPDTKVSRYSDWTVSALWQNNNRSLTATIGHGLPFVYCIKTGDDAQISLFGASTIWYNQNGVIGLTVNGHHYGIFGPSGSVWTGTTTLRSTLAGKDYFSVALLPDNTPATLEVYRKHAYAFVTDTQVSWQYNEATAEVITTFNIAAELKEAGNGNLSYPLIALFRHQWLHTDAQLTSYVYQSPRGQMKVVDAASFTTRVKFNGIVPELPLVSTDGQDGFQKSNLYNFVDTIFKQTPGARWANLNPGDTYWVGKAMGRISRLVHIADFVGHTAARDLFLSELKQRVSSWLDGQGPELYYYDTTWKTLIGFPASYGSDTQLNDHHFHWGYTIIAAATIAQYDPAWAAASEWGGMVELLIKDAANWDRSEIRFPFARMYDLYEGHGWANGSALFAAGNNQESSSESMNFLTAVILWGSMTNNKTIRDFGIYLYTTELIAIEQYWFDIEKAVFPAGFTKPTVGMVWGNGGAYAIWWDGYVEEVHGINFIPITGGSLYLGRNPDYLKINQDYMASNHGGNDAWRDIHMEVTALYDAPKAITLFNTVPFSQEAGESRAHTYHWIHALNALGRLDTTVFADTPLATVFIKNGIRTYVSYNPTSALRSVHFSNGAILNVQPHSMAVGAGTDGDTTTPDTPVPPLGYRVDALEDIDGKITIQFNSSSNVQQVDLYYTLDGVVHHQALAQTAQGWTTTIVDIPDKSQIDYYLTYKQQNVTLSTGSFRLMYAGACAPGSDTGGGTGGGGTTGSGVIEEADFTREVQITANDTGIVVFKPKQPATFVDIHYTVNGGGQLNYRMTFSNDAWTHPVITKITPGTVLKYSFTYTKNGPAYDSPVYTYTRPA